MNNNRVKNVILAVLVVGLVGMTIAYAGLTQQLNITDNQVTVSSIWKIRFASNPTSAASGTASVQTSASLADDRTTLSGLRATLIKPGDYVTVNFTIQNEGTIAAKGSATTINLGNLTCTNGSGSSLTSTQLSTFCGKLKKSVLKSNGQAFSSSDTLAAATSTNPLTIASGGSINGVIKIEYPSSITNSDIADINGKNVVVTLGNTTLHFEQQ